MGMSASQVRLLTITKRIHSVENEAERIQNQKMLLGLQSDEAYEEYLDAMQKMNIEYAYFNGNTGNFEWDDLDLQTVYDLINITGTDYRLKVKNLNQVLPSTVAVTLDSTTQVYGMSLGSFKSTLNDDGKYTYTAKFGIQTITLGDTFTTQYPQNSILISGVSFTYNPATQSLTTTATFPWDYFSITMPDEGTVSVTGVPRLPGYQSTFSYTDVDGNTRQYTGELKAPSSLITTGSQEEWIECNTLAEVCAALNITDSKALTDKTIFRELVYNAYAIIESKIYDEDLQQNVWKETSVATNTGLREKTDDQALALAEANYEAALRRIDKKEEYYDKELAKFDQERKALTTQLETLKTCIKENIDRTFKIFQG